MSYIHIPYVTYGESVQARLERLAPHLKDLESQCRQVVSDHQGGAIELYNKLNDVAVDFYDRHILEMIQWDTWKDDLVTRWWLNMELEDDTPIASHMLTLEAGTNKRYINGIGWIWFNWDPDDLPEYRRVVFQIDGIQVIDPRRSPWECRIPLSLLPRPDGHPPTRRYRGPIWFRHQRDIEWGHVDALTLPAAHELVFPTEAEVESCLTLIGQRRAGLVAEWERLAYNWCSVLGTEWLVRADAYGAVSLDIATNPDILWKHALVFACKMLGIDYVAWSVEAAPECMFLSQLMASVVTVGVFYNAEAEMSYLAPYSRVIVVQRIIEECFRWARPLMDSTRAMPQYTRYESMRDELPRERTSTHEIQRSDHAVDCALQLFDNMLEPFLDTLAPPKKNTA